MSREDRETAHPEGCRCDPPKTWRDPVCGFVGTVSGARNCIEHQERRYWFCSEQCRQIFEAMPDLYAANVEDHLAGQDSRPRFGPGGLPLRGAEDDGDQGPQ